MLRSKVGHQDRKHEAQQPRSQEEEMLLSIVVPCYNEEAVLRELHRRLVAMLEQMEDTSFEIIYMDDGSRDQTPDILRQLQASDSRVRVVALSRNFGHQIAVSAGLEHASGDAVVIIDADLQKRHA